MPFLHVALHVQSNWSSVVQAVHAPGTAVQLPLLLLLPKQVGVSRCRCRSRMELPVRTTSLVIIAVSIHNAGREKPTIQDKRYSQDFRKETIWRVGASGSPLPSPNLRSLACHSLQPTSGLP